MSSSAFVPARLQGLTTREAIADAFYRLSDSFDESDAELLRSAVTPDVVMVAHGRETVGYDALKQGVLDLVGPMDTTHSVTNIRIDVKDEAATTAKLTAKIIAQHYPAGTGASENDRRLLGGSKQLVDLVKDEQEGVWKVRKFDMNIVWYEGDIAIVQPPAK